MPENLSNAQFGDTPGKATRWVPDQEGHAIGWHVLKWHVQRGNKAGKSFGGDGVSTYDYEQHHKMHMRMHEDGKFEVGHEHKHFTPKKGK
jgi:hypothetical protein